MNEFFIIQKYLKPLSAKGKSSLNLTDDIYYDIKKKLAISIDTYVHKVHFLSTEPKFFLKKILRSSLSDLYCKSIKPESYFLSIAVSGKILNSIWLKKISNILKSEQKKFNIFLGGGDTTSSSKFVITITVLGSAKNKPVLRKGSKFNDDIYVTGNIGDSYLGLCLLKKKYNFGSLNNYFQKSYYEPLLPVKLSPYLHKYASSSIDISDGLSQDLKHLLSFRNHGASINLNNLPLSNQCKTLIDQNKISLKDIFSKGDDYQFLFTSDPKNRSKIENLSKKLKVKVAKIGVINRKKDIIFKYKNRQFDANSTKMGYIHTF